ncbi:MAG: hypothetical protein KDE20_02580 [Caldilineaceae bacterium]|nr:hypothetical protein [Caldilineaceae bacterium]
MRIVLDGQRAPSWNKFYAGMHWRERSQLTRAVQMAVRVALPEDVVEGNGYPYQVPVDIEIHAHFAGHPLDADNIAAKLYIDGLKGWLIEDDTLRHVRSVRTVPHLAKQDRVEILIQEMQNG